MSVRRDRLVMAGILILYFLLLLPTVQRYGFLWDEQVDLEIARSYLAGPGGWLKGSGFDPANARLPMYTVALLFGLLGKTSLDLARLVSCAVGGLTLLGVFVFCKAELDRKKGLVACFLLATSPFFLSFARVAFTESDIFVTCALTWFLVCFARLLRMRTSGQALLTALALGLALSSKMSALAVMPAALFAPALMVRRQDRRQVNRRIGKKLATTLGLVILLLLGTAVVWWMSWSGQGDALGWSPTLAYLSLLLLWFGIIVRMLVHRHEEAAPSATGVFLVLFAGAVFLLIPPAHVMNPEIGRGMAKKSLRTLDAGPFFFLEAATFHAGCVLFKSSPLIGAGLWAGLAGAMARWRTRAATRLPVLLFALYFVFLVRMDVAQTFYMMPTLPLLAILASDQLVDLFRAGARRTVAAVCTAALLLLGVDIVRCYPDFNLNGYQYLGARYLAGRSTLGYRSIAQVTTDGVQQAMEWANGHVAAHEKVVTYITAPHIVRAVSPHPEFLLLDGLLEPPAAIRDADYVIVGINAEIADDRPGIRPPHGIYDRPYDAGFLEANFMRVFEVKRVFGIAVATVWRRRPG